MPYTPSLELLAAPSRGAPRSPVPKKTSGDFQAAVEKVASRPEPNTQRPAGEAERVKDMARPLSEQGQEAPPNSEASNENEAAEAASETAPEVGTQATPGMTEPALAEALTALSLLGTTPPVAAGAASGEPTAGAPATQPAALPAEAPKPGVGVTASALGMSAAAETPTDPELLKALAQVQAPGALAPALKATNAMPKQADGSAAAASQQPQGVSLSSAGGAPLALAETPQMLMNWVQATPEEVKTLPVVVGSNTPVEMLDEAAGLEISLPVVTGGDDALPLTDGETETAPPSVNTSSLERGVTETTKAAAPAAPQAPPRAEDVLPQILKHAEALKAQQQNSIKLQLYPEHLGKLEIKVMSHQGVLSAQLTADSMQVKGLLETQLVGLQRSLQEMGLRVDRVEVALSSSNAGGFEGSNASFTDSSPQQRGQDAPPPARMAPAYGSWAVEESDASYAALPADLPDGVGFINAVA